MRLADPPFASWLSSLAVPLLAASAFGQADGVERAFERAGVHWELTIGAKEISEAGAPADLIRFRVLRDGAFVPTGKSDGGRLVSYKYAYGNPADLRVRRLDIGGLGAGWILGGCGSAGNAHHWNLAVVTLGAGDHHFEVHLDSKWWPVVRDLGPSAELWGSYQCWGRGGTASSIFVPYRMAIEPAAPARRATLPLDFTIWPEDIEARSFPSAFVAGIRERSPELMSAALAKLWRADQVDWYAGYGLPEKPAELQEMIDATGRIRDAFCKLAELAPAVDARWDPIPR